jgi:FkbM family methyltransferase
MKIFSKIYKKYLSAKGFSKYVWKFIRKLFIRLFGDPSCKIKVHKKYLSMPLSHSLPDYMERFRFYDRLPGRISEFLREKKEKLVFIDVGANIGDSIAAFNKQPHDLYFAVEPNPNFRKYLQNNWKNESNVFLIKEICSSVSEEEGFAIKEKNGTASISLSTNGQVMKRKTLDKIWSEIGNSALIDLVKIDTDGHDFEVLKGSHEIIRKYKPAIIFECDVFSNTNYLEDCFQALKNLEESGYESFLVYSNFGDFLGRHYFSDLKFFKDLLFYQVTSDF